MDLLVMSWNRRTKTNEVTKNIGGSLNIMGVVIEGV